MEIDEETVNKILLASGIKIRASETQVRPKRKRKLKCDAAKELKRWKKDGIPQKANHLFNDNKCNDIFQRLGIEPVLPHRHNISTATNTTSNITSSVQNGRNSGASCYKEVVAWKLFLMSRNFKQ